MGLGLQETEGYERDGASRGGVEGRCFQMAGSVVEGFS